MPGGSGRMSPASAAPANSVRVANCPAHSRLADTSHRPALKHQKEESIVIGPPPTTRILGPKLKQQANQHLVCQYTHHPAEFRPSRLVPVSATGPAYAREVMEDAETRCHWQRPTRRRNIVRCSHTDSYFGCFSRGWYLISRNTAWHKAPRAQLAPWQSARASAMPSASLLCAKQQSTNRPHQLQIIQ